MTKISDELKWAIVRMPSIEKDKLLLKLIAKDEMLIAKLQHQLLDTESDTRKKKAELLEQIRNHVAIGGVYSNHHTPGLLMMGMRYCNGDITRYAKITNDKLGEIELTLALVNISFKDNAGMLLNNANRAETFAEYVVKKADYVLKKLPKIHEDYYIEIEFALNEMLQNIHNYIPCYHFAKEIKIPKRLER